MTREEKQKAIDALKISAPVMVVTQEEFNDYIQTLNQVMDWLEQEPCSNAIDRDEAIRVASGYCHPANVAKELAKLPPVKVKPEPCGDAISRQAALEAFGLSEKSRKYGGDHSGYDTLMKYEIQDVLEDLPPVTPEPKEMI